MDKLQSAEADFKRLLWIVALFSLFTNLLMLAIPLYMLQIYDRVLPSQSSATLTFLSIIALLALLVLAGMESVRSFLANRIAARFDAGLGDVVLERVIREGSATGGSSQPMRDLSQIRQVIGSRQMFAIFDLPFAAIFIALLYLVHPHLFWITLAGAMVLTFVAWLNQLLSARASAEQAEKMISTGLQTEYLARNADSLVAMGMVGNVINHWGNNHSTAMVSSDKAARVNSVFTGISRFVRLFLQIIILGYGAVLVLQNEMTAGMIFASSLISGRALQPIDQVIASWRHYVSSYASWKRLKKFLGTADQQQVFTTLPRPNGMLEAQEILQPNALDSAARPILSRVSFKLEPGESVAVIGPSGSGKSTLARILVGAVKPRAGTVRIDGHELSHWDPEKLGKYIGYLPQDVDLLPGTIAQNISRFDLYPDSKDIVEAAKMAHVEDLIKTMPKGYDTPIGPGGAQISGGEKQRIGLARAFYGAPRILVLDEPNSSLDKVGEIALNEALKSAKTEMITVFIITQRESALALVDKIMRINKGQIVDFADKAEIMRKYSARPAPKTAPNPSRNPFSLSYSTQTGGKVKSDD